MTEISGDHHPHIALFPSAGMGHLTPFLRLAAALSSFRGKSLIVSLITVHPTVSAAESEHLRHFLAAHPHIRTIPFNLLPPAKPPAVDDDPFFVQFNAICRSSHLLRPVLSSLSPPLSAVFSDFAVAADFVAVADDLGVPNYILTTTSARFFSLLATVPLLKLDRPGKGAADVNLPIPGLPPVPESNIPPPFFNPNHIFTSLTVSSALQLPKVAGILINTFDAFEGETIAAFNSGRGLLGLPPILPIGPLSPYELEKGAVPPWLDEQEPESVVYISFGSRTAMSKDQLRELADGLDRSGHKFLWILKSSKVDKEDTVDLTELVGESFLKKMGRKGVVVKGWVNQVAVLAHPAVGGMVSHGGWNSVTEAAARGVPVLVWPQHGDQGENAAAVEAAGLGMWAREWGWGNGGELVRGEEIGRRIAEMMSSTVRGRARGVGVEARRAVASGGSSEKVLTAVIQGLKKE